MNNRNWQDAWSVFSIVTCVLMIAYMCVQIYQIDNTWGWAFVVCVFGGVCMFILDEVMINPTG